MKYFLNKITTPIFFAVILFLIFFLQTCPIKIFASTVITVDTLTVDSVWSKEASPYLVSELIIPAGIKLTLQPGVVIKFGSNSKNDSISISGTLDVQGTFAEPVYFTSFKDDLAMGDTNNNGQNNLPYPGNWSGLIINNGGQVNMNHAVVRYGGYFEVFLCGLTSDYISNNSIIAESEDPANSMANIYNNGGILIILNSVIERGNNYGIRHNGGETKINSSVIQKNGLGIYNETAVIIDAKNNFWGNPAGPYNNDWNLAVKWDKVLGPVDYTPWLLVDPTLVQAKNPVIIIPGILSSYLNQNTYDRVEVWPNLLKALVLGDDDYLDELSLNELGQPDLTHSVMLPTDIFRKVEVLGLGVKDIFDGLIVELENNGYVENENMFVFPYDWRLNLIMNVDSLYSPLLTTLKDKVDQVLEQTHAEKVDIIAHSMGGLLAKYYIAHYGQDKVDKFIDIATPHLGAPGSFKSLVYGDNAGIQVGVLGLNPLKIKEISQNSPAVYQLLPSPGYFSTSLPDYNYYIYDMNDYDNNDTKGRLSFEESLDFLKNTGRNSLVMNYATNIHNELDTINPSDYGVSTYNIVGCGTPTFGKIFTLGKQSDIDQQYDVAYIGGDGTVPQRSAEAITSFRQYYASSVKHSTMPSTSGIKKLVGSILNNDDENFDFTSHSNISKDTSSCTLPDGTFLGFHSPVELHIYDEVGNHTGPNVDGYIEENIPNIAYDVIDGNKFTYLPNGEDYRIELKAISQGSFSSHIKKITAGQVISTNYFNDIHLESILTEAVVDINSNSGPVIILDFDGDDINSIIINPSSVLEGDSLSDLISPITELKIISPATSTEGVYYEKVQIIFEVTDIDSGVLKTEYSLDLGSNYQEATSTIIISNVGTNTILYRSTDKAGNIENVQESILNIGEPVVVLEPTPVVTKNRSSRSHTKVVVVNSSPETIVFENEIIPIKQPEIDIFAVKSPPIIDDQIEIKEISSLPPDIIPEPVATTSIVIPLLATVADTHLPVRVFTIIFGIFIILGLLVFINKKYMIKL